MTKSLIIAVSVVIAGLRCFGVKDEIFQAIAHLWVGGLFAAGFLGKRWCLYQGIGLSVVEVACFILMGKSK